MFSSVIRPAVFSAVLLALVAGRASAATPPFNLPDKGVLRLQLGTTITDNGLHSPKRFVHEPSGLTEAINTSGKCGLALSGSNLATLTAAGGRGVLGLGDNSIGVYDGANGVACYRITAPPVAESVAVGLGSDLASPLVDANAFYRLELDIEVKKNAEFLLQILANGSVIDTYRLRSGGSILPGQGSTSPGSPDHIFNCTAQSDSGPDSGSRDNCRWIVDALGKGFRLVALAGEGSLEGGGDFGTAAYANDSLIFLTKGEIGALGCNSSQVPQGTDTSTIGDGVNDAQCGVTRIDPTGIGGSCTVPIGYVFRTIEGASEGCNLEKSPGEQLAASMDILFPPETATALGAEPLTLIQFSTNVPGQFVSFTPARCTGTVVQDHNGNLTIAEVLTNPGFAPDLVPATSAKDWACILNNSQEYIGAGKMQVRQTVLFWGDISVSRH